MFSFDWLGTTVLLSFGWLIMKTSPITSSFDCLANVKVLLSFDLLADTAVVFSLFVVLLFFFPPGFGCGGKRFSIEDLQESNCITCKFIAGEALVQLRGGCLHCGVLLTCLCCGCLCCGVLVTPLMGVALFDSLYQPPLSFTVVDVFEMFQ
jgi:hypothetical protein